MKELFSELADEITDFFEDYAEHIFKRKPTHNFSKRPASVNGALILVRPAYLFAERVENLLKIIFGISIIISAATTTFFGFTSLSEFLKFLINNLPGRIIMFLIGISYLLIACWKIIHIGKKS